MNRLLVFPFVVVGVIAAAILLSRVGTPSGGMPGGPAPSGGGAPMVDVQLPAELSADATFGKAVFDAKCAACHGANAAGQQGIAPPLVHKIYEPSHHGDMAFQLAARTGVRAHHWSFGNMPPVEGISDPEIAQVTLYIRELQRENGIR